MTETFQNTIFNLTHFYLNAVISAKSVAVNLLSWVLIEYTDN